MPELPEVQTTVSGLKKVLPKLTIVDVWSDLPAKTSAHKGKETIKDLPYFSALRNAIRGKKILTVERRAKNILIALDKGKTLLIHMKMTGHLLYGKYAFNNPSTKLRAGEWRPTVRGPLDDPFNRFIHVVFTLSNSKHLVLSDMRKFAKVVLLDTASLKSSPHISMLGPEPLERSFTFEKFKASLARKPNLKIKRTLMDQSIVAGIGNIYSDEVLWHAGVHPEEPVKNIPTAKMRKMYDAMKLVLKRGIDFSGDSTSDYRTITGERGKFHLHHEAYRRTGEKCSKRDGGGILRKKLGGRSAHFCSVHQALKK